MSADEGAKLHQVEEKDAEDDKGEGRALRKCCEEDLGDCGGAVRWWTTQEAQEEEGAAGHHRAGHRNCCWAHFPQAQGTESRAPLSMPSMLSILAEQGQGQVAVAKVGVPRSH